MKKKLLSATLLAFVLVCLSMPISARPGAGVGGEPPYGGGFDPFVEAFVLE